MEAIAVVQEAWVSIPAAPSPFCIYAPLSNVSHARRTRSRTASLVLNRTPSETHLPINASRSGPFKHSWSARLRQLLVYASLSASCRSRGGTRRRSWCTCVSSCTTASSMLHVVVLANEIHTTIRLGRPLMGCRHTTAAPESPGTHSFRTRGITLTPRGTVMCCIS